MSQSSLACRFLCLFAAVAFVGRTALGQDEADSRAELLKNGAADSLDDWRSSGGVRDAEVGRTDKGSLKIQSKAGEGFVDQIVELGDNLPSRLKFSVHVKTRGLKSYTSVRLMAGLIGRGQPTTYALGEFVQEDTADWKQLTLVFDLPRGYTTVRPMVSLRGEGTAWIDDLSL